MEDWVGQAECRKIDPAIRSELFFPEPGDSHEAAKAICARCPVQAACLDHALRSGEHHGIWGGTSAKERTRIVRARRRGLPDPKPRTAKGRQRVREFDLERSAVASAARRANAAAVRRRLTPTERSERMSQAAQKRWLRDRPIPTA